MDEVCNKNKEASLVNKIMSYEADEMSQEEEISFFQELINSGMAWNLQGHYGRMAVRLIEEGLCQTKET